MKRWPAVIVAVTCGQVFREGQKVHKDARGDAVEKYSHVASHPALNSAPCGEVSFLHKWWKTKSVQT